MVSKASEDLPDPDSPVITVNRSRGISTLIFLRLCWRAPLTLMRSMAIAKTSHSSGRVFGRQAREGTWYFVLCSLCFQYRLIATSCETPATELQSTKH